MKKTPIINGEGILLGRFPVDEQRRPGRHQTSARKKWTKEDNKFAITCYLKVKEEGQSVYRKRMHQYWMKRVDLILRSNT